MNKLQFRQMPLGCDPEFFFKRNGQHIGAEKVIGKDGIMVSDNAKFITDGVQAELNPRANTCRANLANHIKSCMIRLKSSIPKNVKTDFVQHIKLDKKELDSLHDDNKMFGCDPSSNVYTGKTTSLKVKNPLTKRTRVAGGHLHFGWLKGEDPHKYGIRIRGNNSQYHPSYTDEALATPERTVPLLDLILGNTCVLIDADPTAKSRRKLYGKAGEYRTPVHGLEYRVLSNFWLRSYPLMSFVFGVGRLAILISAMSFRPTGLQGRHKPNTEMEDRLLSLVSRAKVKQAINNNNWNLAYSNFQAIKPVLLEICSGAGYTESIPFSKTNIYAFEYFITKPIEHWFPDDPMHHWCTLGEEHVGGWEAFLNRTVKREAEKDEAVKFKEFQKHGTIQAIANRLSKGGMYQWAKEKS